ncbi:hypothetical protein AMS68_001273 [Peltaster fructicola]|uniref:MATE efflux family protein n=1 Tax=Peltaster fructicola TaxID=286661 RepID=A0A6H0XM22_9PEZI|nr:hypothetical protein AMS68_001273 [Peltaster fructicola]
MPTNPKTIPPATGTITALPVVSRSLGSSWTETATISREAVERDFEDVDEDNDNDSEDVDESDASLLSSSAPAHTNHVPSLYRRPSYVAAGRRRAPYLVGADRLSKEEWKQAIEEERSLLRDNNLIPPKHNESRNSLFRVISIPRSSVDVEASETAPLLSDRNQPYGGQADANTVSQKWDEAVREGKIHTSWQREAKVLVGYSLPLMATFLLQYSLTVASIFALGHLGTTELAAASLASMTANISGYAIYQGLTTSLDTLCAQAFGSGRKKLVGLQMQRAVAFLMVVTVPIAIVWLLADKILIALVPEEEVAALAGLYLKVILAGAPGYAMFEAGKRYVQAQGLFSASLYVLLVLSPLNAFMNWFFVWHLHWGFIGAPIAVAITDNLLPVGLFLYVRFCSKKGMQCWNGFTWKAWQNWSPMVRLALPGLIMVEAEVLAFEILTFAASYFGVEVLAAQSVLATLTSITWQIPFPLSIAASTRVANLIGATLADAAKVTTKVAFFFAVVIGLLNVTILSSLKDYIPRLFTSDPVVIQITSDILPLCAAFQLFDALAALCNGTLRGLGRQHFGGYVQLFCYYAVAMPISMGTGFGLGWELWGLWSGVAIALGLVALIEFVYLARTDWNRSVDEAQQRNATT